MNIFSWLFPKEKTGGKGLAQSPVDYRDINMTALAAPSTGVNPTPPAFQIPYKLTKRDQGQSPECAAYTGATMMEFLMRAKGEVVEFDPDDLYKQAKLIDGMPNFAGTYFRAILQVLKNTGAMPLGGTPADRAKYRIDGYVQVDCTFDAIKRAIYEHGAVLLGWHGSNGGWQTAMVRAPKPGEVVWGHATTGIGFDVVPIYSQNSWGENWGNDGDFQFPQSYLPFECWAILSTLPENWNDILPPKPQIKHTFNIDLVQGSTETVEVKALQDCLVSLGCMLQSDVNSGYGTFGAKTKNGVTIFQGRYNLPETGNVMTLTRAQLNTIFS